MEVKKRMQLMFNVQNDTIINKIMGVFKIMMKSIINKLESVLIWIGYNWVGYKVDIIALEEEIKALELAITMAKNDHINLQDSFNKYVLRPKAEEVLKDYEGGK